MVGNPQAVKNIVALAIQHPKWLPMMDVMMMVNFQLIFWLK
jgi:hypothetical protein